MKNNDKILIIGTGSIAQRHIKNIFSLYKKKKKIPNIFIFSRKKARKTIIIKKFHTKINFLNNKNNFKKIKFDYIFITSDISSHIKWLKFFKKDNVKIFCEKPVVINEKEIHWLEKNKMYFQKVFVGFQFRFNPITIKLKKILKRKEFGKLLLSKFDVGQDIKDWRKNTDYKKELAFGKTNKKKRSVIWELCHDVDLMFHLIGYPKKIFGQESKIKYKRMYTKDFAHLITTHKNNSKTIISQNMFSPIIYKNIKMIFQKALVSADFINGKIFIKIKDKKKKKFLLEKDRNISFMRELDTFLKNKKTKVNSLNDGLKVSKFINRFQNKTK